jgi:hypothetical protein
MGIYMKRQIPVQSPNKKQSYQFSGCRATSRDTEQHEKHCSWKDTLSTKNNSGHFACG